MKWFTPGFWRLGQMAESLSIGVNGWKSNVFSNHVSSVLAEPSRYSPPGQGPTRTRMAEPQDYSSDMDEAERAEMEADPDADADADLEESPARPKHAKVVSVNATASVAGMSNNIHTARRR